jgi:3-isopropylmalate/(R)-2-methylmalate dehydratase small subunit
MSTKPFTEVIGPAAPLLRENVDTDVIIRIERLTALDRDQLGPYALEALRFQADGSEDPAFILNQPAFRTAPILLAGSNFGCGSSREAAVWALLARGIRCVIAPSFGDIFFSNCFQNGLLPVRLPQARIDLLAAAARTGVPLKVDLRQGMITGPGGEAVPFTVDPLRREGLLLGLDDIESTLRNDEGIRAWQRKDRGERPWAWLATPPISSRP